MVNLNVFINKMTNKLGLSERDIIDDKHSEIYKQANIIIDNIIKDNKDVEIEITTIFNSLLESDDEINNILGTFISTNSNNIKEFKITLAKIQLKILLNKYNKVFIDKGFIDALNNKLDAVLKIMESNLTNNKYYIYFKYLKYKNKYLLLKYNYI